MSKHRVFAGNRLRNLRISKGLNQPKMAEILGISVSYLSQIEHDDRSLTPRLLQELGRSFPLDWEELEEDVTTRRIAALREAAADPLFTEHLSVEQLARIAEQLRCLVDEPRGVRAVTEVLVRDQLLEEAQVRTDTAHPEFLQRAVHARDRLVGRRRPGGHLHQQ